MFGQTPGTAYDLRFSILGIPVRVHPIFWLTAAFITWNGDRLDLVVVGVLCVFAAVLFHELGHAAVTRYFGWYPEIVLTFFGGYATTTRHSTWRNIAVTAAGPLTGFAFYGVCLAIVNSLVSSGIQVHMYVAYALNVLIYINLWWSILNLMPVFPLDGGQITRELLIWLSPRKGYGLSLVISMVAGGLLAVAGYRYLGSPFLTLLFAMLAFQSYQEYEQVKRGYW